MAATKLAFVALALVVHALLSAEPAASLVAPTTTGVNSRCCNKYGGACNDLGVYKAGNACTVGSCCGLRVTIPAGTRITFDCYVVGESVGINNHWLHVTSPATYAGWLSDKYVNCGGKLCNVPLCNVRQVDVRRGITLTTITPLPKASWMVPLINCFFSSYAKERARFNPRATAAATVIFNNGGGIASTLGSTITVDLGYLSRNPRDYGFIAHEAMHVAQAYGATSVPGYWIEGLADYARYRYGCNIRGVWFLPLPRPGDYYDDSYGVTARFLVWIEKRYPAIITALDASLRDGTYTDAFWVRQTARTKQAGRTVAELWSSYIASPTI